jgi:glycosyltransferase involved in cell wall biosynthesis
VVRALIVTGNMHVGGAEMAALDLVRRLQGEGRWFTIASLRREGPMGDAFIHAGARLHEGIAPRRFDAIAPLRLANIMRHGGIEAVIVLDPLRNGLFYALAGAALSMRRPARICWCHAWPGGQAGNFAAALRAYHSAGLLDAVVCVSRAQRRELVRAGLPRHVMPVIPDGIDLARFSDPRPSSLPLPPGKRIVVQVANDMPDKDFPTLLEAAGSVAHRRRDFHLLLVGRNTDSPQISRAVAEAGLSEMATLAGQRDDVPGILARADVFVLSSRRETFALAVLEAMAAGLPVVASDLAALAELLSNGKEGLLVPPGDADALAGGIERVLDDAALSRQLGEAARRRAATFSSARMAARFERLLRLLIRRE